MMNPKNKEAIFREVKKEPFARVLNMTLVELDDGYAAVEMVYDPERMDNIFNRAHGGALFALMDEAFEAVNQTSGTLGLALNVNVTYIASPQPGTKLRAVAKQISETKKTASFDIKVKDGNGNLIATCHALGYRTGKPLPFI
jgi:acyl-CoA thioesterase